MTPLTPSRRAAEEFASVLEGSRPDLADRYADLTSCVGLLERHHPITPRPEHVADLRSRLMDAADTMLLPADAELAPMLPSRAPAEPPRARRRERRLGAVAVAFVLVGGSAGVAAAAEGSLPGDTLYPIKRSLESAKVTLNTSDKGKGADLLDQAGTRLREVDRLVADAGSSRTEAERIDQALEDFQASAAKGSDLILAAYQHDADPAGLSELRDFAATQMERLQAVSEEAPASSKDAFTAAASLLADIDRQASALCGVCGSALLQIPATLLASASALSDLLSVPVPQAGGAPAQQAPSAAQELATAAQEIAKTMPKVPAPLAPPVAANGVPSVGGTSGAKGGSGGTGGILGNGEAADQVTQPLKTVTNAVTSGAGQTLGIIDGMTAGLTTPLTGLVTSTVDTLVNALLGTGASNATGSKSSLGKK